MAIAILAITALLGLYMAWNIGANDVANSMAAAVGSKSISIKRAIIAAGICEFAGAVLVGKTVRDAIDFQLAIGPAGEVFREAGDESEEKRDQIEAALAEAIEAQKTDADGIVMDSSSWVISARNPS